MHRAFQRHDRAGMGLLALFAVALAAACSSGARSSGSSVESPASTTAVVKTTDAPITAVQAAPVPSSDASAVDPATTGASSTNSTSVSTVTATEVPSGCGEMTTGAHEMDVLGLRRSYIVAEPENVELSAGSRAAPLILLFHGFGGSAQAILSRTAIGPLADREGVVLVSLQGQGQPPTWHIGFPGSGDEDFTAAVLEAARKSPCIDPSRIWLAGFSAGSAWVGDYVCNHPDGIAGILMHSSVPAATCAADETPEVLIAYGEADTVVPYAGGPHTVGDATVQLQPVLASAASWAATAQCAAQPTIDHTTSVDTFVTWPDCRSGHTVTLLAVAGLGHEWSGGAAAPGSINPGCLVVEHLAGAQNPITKCLGST